MNKKIGKETFYLYLVQLSNVFIPLITIPYLTNVLGIEFFGKFSYAQAVALIAVFFIDFGFNYSAARLISLNINNKSEIDKIYSHFQAIKILFFLVFIMIGFSISHFVINSKLDALLFMIGVSSAISSVIIPSWLFQGLGQNSLVAISNIVVRIFSLPIIFLTIRRPDDLVTVVLIQLFYPTIAGFFIQYFIIRKSIASFSYKSLKIARSVYLIKESMHNFSASFLTLGFTYFNPILIKCFIGDAPLGIYSIADKLATVLRQLYNPLIQANFSYICFLFEEKQFSLIINILKRISFIFLFISFFALLLNLIIDDYVINLFFGIDYNVSFLLSIMIFSQLVISLSMIIVNLAIIPSGYSYYLKKVYFVALISYFTIIYPMIKYYGINGVAVSIGLVEALIVILFYNFLRKNIFK
ncbi:MAG: oligosaccharide flippase family protein [Candidatus Malihini olakiniferum]